MQLQRLFEPHAIALIGASRDSKKVGASILTNLRAGGFRGKLYPVNPTAQTIQGLRCYPSVTHVTGAIDVAVIAVPAALVGDILIACGKKKIPFAIIVTSGFGELGSEGKAQEQRIKDIARKYKITIVGPNCLGIIATGSHMNASFGGALPQAGTIACVSQSGALLVSLVDWSHEAKVGLRTLVSIGNQAGLSELAVLEYLAADPGTSVIGIYSEQISNGPAFMAAVARCTRRKPVVVLKAGVSEAGSKAVSSHTGSLAGSAQVMSALLAQAGALQAYDVEDFFKLLELCSYGYQNSSRSVAVLTNAGGPGVIASDLLSNTSLRLASFSGETTQALRKALPHGAAIANPVDLMGDADLVRFKKALSILDADPETGVILVMLTPQRMTPVDAIARHLGAFQKRSQKQIIACFIGGTALRRARSILIEQGVICFSYPYDAIRVLALSKAQTRSKSMPVNTRSLALYTGEKKLMPYSTMQRLLSRKGFPLTKGSSIQTVAQAKRLRGFPLALKALSTRAIHKARSGAVALDVMTAKEAALVTKRFIKQFKGKGFEGILAQPMMRGGKEFIMGLKRDPVAGMVILVGIGGSLTEELGDTVVHIGQLKNTAEARACVEGIRHTSFLKDIDRGFLAGLLKKLSDFGLEHPEVYELDFNPVQVHRTGGSIIDARIFTRETK